MPNILCRKVSFGYDGTERNIFTDLDLLIDTGWRTALTGRNGRGKTTLLRLVHGELAPDRGRIESPVATRRFPAEVADPTLCGFDVAKDAAGPYRRWEAEMAALLDGGDDDRNLDRYGTLQARFQEAGGYTIDADLERELAALDIGPSLRTRPFDRLSGGERTRCLLAGLFARDNGFALVDEPTNHLDRGGRALLAEYLRAKPGFLLVSHDRAFLDACIDHVIALNRDTVETRRGAFSTWRAEFLQRLEEQERGNTELRREIGRLEQAGRDRRKGALAREADKGAHMDKGFIGARAARQMKRALAAERRGERAVGLLRETPRRTKAPTSRDSAQLAWPPSGRAGRHPGDRPIESMSPGQQKTIELARSFLTPADLLLWDEPLNFLDLDAREAIEEVVVQDAPTLVFVEHDAAFVDRVATKSVELIPGSPVFSPRAKETGLRTGR